MGFSFISLDVPKPGFKKAKEQLLSIGLAGRGAEATENAIGKPKVYLTASVEVEPLQSNGNE